MSKKNIVDFLSLVAGRADILDALKVKSKDEVIAAAKQFGYPFDDSEFNSLIWNLEIQLAEKRQENFDAHFPLWQTMWGKYYLEYLVTELISSLKEKEILTDGNF